MAKINKNIIQQVVQQTVKKAVKQNIPGDARLLERFVKYQEMGLNYRSNDDNINVRNNAGPLKLNENDEKHPVLIIEPSSNNILNESILKVIDTQFNYFKFPATTRIVESDNVDLDLDIDLTVDQEVEDPIYARYKPIDQQQIPAGANNNFAGELEMSEIEEGVSQKRPNRYYITKQIKDSGADLRFRVKINFRYDSPDSDFNTTYFYITRFKPEAKFINLQYKEFFTFENPLAGGGRIDQYNVQEATKEVVIANTEFDVGDSFALFGLAGKGQPADEFKYSTINPDQTYWSITDASKNVDEWNRERTNKLQIDDIRKY